MKPSESRALVPFGQRLPARPTVAQPPDFDLVAGPTRLTNTEQVERHLPDIIGRALARIWIDRAFRDDFAADPKGTLAFHDVHLPPTIDIDFVSESGSRPQVVVHEQLGRAGQRRRLLFLQLVMVAGK